MSGIEEVVSIEELHTMRKTTKKEATQSMSHKEWVELIVNGGCAATPTLAQTQATKLPLIQRVPQMLRDTQDFEKYYTPRVVSIGPYHYGNPKLELVQKLKLKLTSKFIKNDEKKLEELYNKVLLKLEEVRKCYAENSTNDFDNESFARMMVVDGCFILYYIQCNDNIKELEMKSHDIAFVQQDLFLLENQIPFSVLQELMDGSGMEKINNFITINMMTLYKPKEKWCSFQNFSPCLKGGSNDQQQQGSGDPQPHAAHLLQLLHIRLVDKFPDATPYNDNYTVRSVNELLAVGIYVKPRKSRHLTHIVYTPHFGYAYLELPPITVDDSTRPKFLNLIAYEMGSDVSDDAPITSYICFLDSLIDHAEDVKELRTARVLTNCMGSDEEVAKLFNEISTELVPNPCAYGKVKIEIQKRCNNKGITWINQFKHEHFKNPWSTIALLGAILALILSGIQAFFSVWSLPSDCDHLCSYIKNNHHI